MKYCNEEEKEFCIRTYVVAYAKYTRQIKMVKFQIARIQNIKCIYYSFMAVIKPKLCPRDMKTTANLSSVKDQRIFEFFSEYYGTFEVTMYLNST